MAFLPCGAGELGGCGGHDRLKMKPKLAFAIRAAILGCLFLGTAAVAADSKLEAQLVWGTNDKDSPNPNHKPVDAKVRERLQQLPLKFTNYFLVNQKTFTLPATGSQRVQLSHKCDIEVKKQSEDEVEVSVIGKGAQVVKRRQPLPKGEMLVVGGNAPNSTAWLVIVKKLE